MDITGTMKGLQKDISQSTLSDSLDIFWHILLFHKGMVTMVTSQRGCQSGIKAMSAERQEQEH